MLVIMSAIPYFVRVNLLVIFLCKLSLFPRGQCVLRLIAYHAKLVSLNSAHIAGPHQRRNLLQATAGCWMQKLVLFPIALYDICIGTASRCLIGAKGWRKGGNWTLPRVNQEKGKPQSRGFIHDLTRHTHCANVRHARKLFPCCALEL